MTDNEILSHIDHTLLRPTSTVSEIDALCDEAISLKQQACAFRHAM